MLQLEPGRTPYDLSFRVCGIPVRVHPFFWLAIFILGYGEGHPKEILIWILAVFVSILVHELGHALTMRRFGNRARIVLYHFGGLAIADASDYPDWMPPKQHDTLRQSILITLAGPAAGFALAAVLAVVLLGTGGAFHFAAPKFGSPIFWSFELPKSIPAVVAIAGANGELSHEYHPLYILCHDLFYINIFWGLVNLLPIIPLDGGQILRDLLTARDRFRGLDLTLQISTVVAVLVALVGFFLMADKFMGFMFAMLGVMNYRLWQQLRARF